MFYETIDINKIIKNINYNNHIFVIFVHFYNIDCFYWIFIGFTEFFIISIMFY